MTAKSTGLNWLKLGTAFILLVSPTAALADAPKTPQEFAERYMAAFNKQDAEALHKLVYPTTAKSKMQEVIDAITDADMKSGTVYNKYEILSVDAKLDEPAMGPDGIFYKPTLKPTNTLKLTGQSKDSSTTTSATVSFPIGEKDGVYYAVSVVPAEGMTVPFNFGWQRFQPPKSNWSVMMPNEPEPGKAALVAESGKDALEDPDAYGVIKNTADMKSWQHFYRCAEEGKRLNADENKETYYAACTTYDAVALKSLYSDPKKNLDEAIHVSTVALDGKVIDQKDVELAGAPGKEFEIRGADGTTCLGRAYWVKDALYVLTVESKKDKPDAASASKFLSSLEVK